MAVVSCVELPRERSQSGKFRETYRYTRAWMVRVDDVNTPLKDISNAPGVSFLDPHPDDPTCRAMEFSTKPDSNSLLHYVVTDTYYAPPAAADGDSGKPPELLPGIPTLWSATSSVGSAPLIFDATGRMLKNSSGVPFPSAEADCAGFKLTLKRPWADYTWQALAMRYTNAVNSDTFMGQPARSWKCQGMSATPETQNAAGVTRSYWSTSWEFEYRLPKKVVTSNAAGVDTVTEYPGWDLPLMDMGYTAHVDESGQPDPSPGNAIGTIRDKKGQPIKEPMGLRNGFAVTPPDTGDVLVFRPYVALPFTSVFGV